MFKSALQRCILPKGEYMWSDVPTANAQYFRHMTTGARHLMIAYTKSMIVYESMHSFGAITLAP